MFGVFAFFIYQGAILPGIRQTLRFELFALRDELRALVVNRVVSEQNRGFVILHAHLNFMVTNLPRFDVYGAVRALNSLNQEERRQVKESQALMEHTPEEIRRIYERSVRIFIKAMVFNSSLFFAFFTIQMLLETVLSVGVVRFVEVLRRKAREDATTAFFNLNQAIV
jgi:hypothetical protein